MSRKICKMWEQSDNVRFEQSRNVRFFLIFFLSI
jgi:hypothetical protein